MKSRRWASVRVTDKSLTPKRRSAEAALLGQRDLLFPQSWKGPFYHSIQFFE